MSIVIIGGSHAGISLAENLRRGGYKNKITIIEKQKKMEKRQWNSKLFLNFRLTSEIRALAEYRQKICYFFVFKIS